MEVLISISELGWDQSFIIYDNMFVHSILYNIVDNAQKAGVQRASDIYFDLASYGLYYQKNKNSSLSELPKDQMIKINNFTLKQQLLILHRGKKATQNRRRDEETFRIKYETSKDKDTDTTINRIDSKLSSNIISRPKRKSTINVSPKNTQKRRKINKKSTIHHKESIVKAVTQADEISKIKKKIQITTRKRMRNIQTRKQKLNPLQVNESSSDIQLQHIIRCHSKGESNYKNDFTTPVYCVDILPMLTSNDNNSVIICTGGAHKICFLDCQTGKVLKMFQASPSESFYCVSSTIIRNFKLNSNSNEEDSIIIAAAGKQSDIKLIHYNRNECYSILKGHSGNINELQFSPKTSYHLLSASSDESIILWDIRENGKQIAKI